MTLVLTFWKKTLPLYPEDVMAAHRSEMSVTIHQEDHNLSK
jgi:phosphoserine aminotransferase